MVYMRRSGQPNASNEARTQIDHPSMDSRNVRVWVEHGNSIANKGRICYALQSRILGKTNDMAGRAETLFEQLVDATEILKLINNQRTHTMTARNGQAAFCGGCSRRGRQALVLRLRSRVLLSGSIFLHCPARTQHRACESLTKRDSQARIGGTVGKSMSQCDHQDSSDRAVKRSDDRRCVRFLLCQCHTTTAHNRRTPAD
jgi:hypothetical protein